MTWNKGRECYNYELIRSVGLLLELMKWNPKRNADRVSAMGMLAIFRAERYRYITNSQEDKTKGTKSVYSDPFWHKKPKRNSSSVRRSLNSILRT